MPVIQVGEQAPNFTLRDQHGESHSLTDYKGRSVVLYFYPEDDTPLCTAQACQFRDSHPDFTKVKTTVLGISPQGSATHAAFVAKHALPFTLLADVPKGEGVPAACTKYGVWTEKNMYGKTVVGMVRTTYLIGPDGTVARRWDRVKTPGHATAVLEAARALHRGEALIVKGKPRALKSTPARQKTRTQGGHAEYTGVMTSRTTKKSAGSRAAKVGISKAGMAKARAGETRGRAGR